MEGISIIIIIIVLVIIAITQNSKLSKMDSKMNALGKQMQNLDSKILLNFEMFYKELKEIRESKPVSSKKTASPEGIKTVPPPIPIVEEKGIPILPIDPVILPKPIVEKEVAKAIIPTIKTERVAIEKPTPKKVIKPKAPKKPSFMERNPDLEKFIGEDLLPKIGIVIFVIGMGFLVKLGIDNGVVTPGMRVAIGVLCAGGMIGLAHYLRKTFATFGSILIGGALSVLYYTIALAFHDYDILPQAAAFVIMVLITGFGVLLSITYDRKELAILAIVGGFGTPFFISTGSGNFSVLLTYILILDIGMLALVYFKKWNIINYITYAFTYILFVAVYYEKFIGHENETRFTFLLFLTLYYLIFFVMSLVYNVKNKRKFEFKEVGMLLSNSAIYFGLGLSLLHGFKDGLYSGIFTLTIAVFNFGFTYVLFKRKDIDRNLLFLLIGLVLTFVSLVAPIQLKGNYITLFWAIEGVLLMWLSQKSGIKIMKFASAIVTTLMLVSLVMDWQQNYFPVRGYIELNVFLNKAFSTSIVAIASLFGTSFLLKTEKEEFFYRNFKVRWLANFIKTTFVVVLYFGIMIELNYQFLRAEYITSLRLILLGIYNYIFLIGLTATTRLNKNDKFTLLIRFLTVPVLFSYLTLFLNQAMQARNQMLRSVEDVSTGYYWHYLLLLLFLGILANYYVNIHKRYGLNSKIGIVSLWILAFVGVYLASFEISHIAIISQYSSSVTMRALDTSISKTILPVVWGISALTMMLLGMRYKLKTLRIASLGLFLITLIKLFLWDLQDNTTGKIVSFILLGVMLLVVSFLYQKLKFIIQDDDENKK